MPEYSIGAAIRGNYIERDLVKFGGRHSGIEFYSPDPYKIVADLPLGDPTRMSDLYDLTFENILEYLEELGRNLELKTNPYMQEALEASFLTAEQTPSLLTAVYQTIPQIFKRPFVREVAETRIGIKHLEGWGDTRLLDGRIISIRAFGARTLHISAGNTPAIAALGIMRNAIIRSDAIIKSPSNDPFTALAIARTMIDMAPDHPLTKHLSVAYWKGGDEAFEAKLYQPHNIEKIVAWGGFASIKHVTKYIQPGLELINLDPKRSISIIGEETFQCESTQKDVARRLATDIGSMNQEGCVNARVVYVLSGTDDQGIKTLNQFGQYVYDALIALPQTVSTKPKTFDQELLACLKAARMNDEWFNVIGGKNEEGAIVVSQTSEPVDFAPLLANRVANLVPIDDVEQIYPAMNSYTQTVGIYPESLRKQLRDKLPLYGAQRLISLGYALSASFATPQDGIEPLRRMCKWIVEESCDPNIVPPLWEDGQIFHNLEEK